jgi:hypothetical protein
MAALEYVGPPVGTNRTTLGYKSYVDEIAATALTQQQADARISELLSGYATTQEVDIGDAGAATLSYVQQQDALRIPLSWKGAANGIATLSGGKVVSSQVTLTGGQRLVQKMYSPSSYHSSTVSITTNTATLFTVSIPNPGYDYRLEIHGYVETNSSVNGGGVIVRARRNSSGGTLLAEGFSRQSASNWSECTFVPVSHAAMSGASTIYFTAIRAGSSGTMQVAPSWANTYVQVIPA